MKNQLLYATIILISCFTIPALAQWTAPVPVTVVNTSGDQWSPYQSYDGLTLYYSNMYYLDGDIYKVTRSSTSDPFSNPTLVLSTGGSYVYGAWVSADNLRMYYTQETPNVGWKIKFTQRNSETDPWPQGTDVSALNSIRPYVAISSLTQDELNIYYTVNPGNPNTYSPTEIYTANRPDRYSTFTNIHKVTELCTTDYYDNSAFVSPDGLTVFFSSDRDKKGTNAIYTATRQSMSDPFGNIQKLSILDIEGRGCAHPSLSADGTALYFIKYSDTQNLDVYVSYQGELTFTKTADVAQGECVVPGREISYTITYDFNGLGDSNVSVVDYLPVEIDYISSSAGGVYDDVSRTVTWDIGTVPPNGNDALTIRGIVNYQAAPFSIFTNTSNITGDDSNASADVNTSVCNWNEIISIYDVNEGNCVVPGQEIDYAINYQYTGIGDNSVVVIDYLPQELDYFSSIPEGIYNPVDRSVLWDIGTVPPGGGDTIIIKCIVNSTADPCGIFTNICRIASEHNDINAQTSTSVCQWNQVLNITDNSSGNCFVPNQQIDYTINYQYTGIGDSNAVVIDNLPIEVDYNSSIPAGDYNAVNRTVTWNIGTIPPNGSGTITLKCYVNYQADSCGVFTNSCNIQGDFNSASAQVTTTVCFYNQIIYVDHNATGVNNGLTWHDAYLDLQSALNKALIQEHSEIWVARGTYAPTVFYQGYPTFRIVDGTPLYGHFAGNETSKLQRNFNDANNETILNKAGAVWPQFIVTVNGGYSQNNILDGFTIKDCTMDSVYINNSYLSVSNCIITNGSGTGIIAVNSTCKIKDCFLQNKSIGISISSSVYEIDDCVLQDNGSKGISIDLAYNASLGGSHISNCQIKDNSSNYGIYISRVPLASAPLISRCYIKGNAIGIYTQNGSCATIVNTIIYNNCNTGILLQNPGLTTIRNDTIYEQCTYGIRRIDGGVSPLISNCIIWNNLDDLYNCTATYSNIGDLDENTGNIHTDPCFMNIDTGDFHLRPDSNCIDAGDPNFQDFNDRDFDGQPRIMFGRTEMRVDIGADEFTISADYDHNGIINFIDYSIWSAGWQIDDCGMSLDGDNDVDMDDMVIFGDNWLKETQ